MGVSSPTGKKRRKQFGLGKKCDVGNHLEAFTPRFHDARALTGRPPRRDLVQPELSWIVAILCITVLALLMRSI